MPEQPSTNFEREKWNAEHKLREREHGLRVREVRNKENWLMAIAVAVGAAFVAAIGNIVVTYWTASSQRNLEEYKAEAARILEVIKPSNTKKDQAATYLEFLIATGLIHVERRKEIQQYLDQLKVEQEVRIKNLRQQVRENSTLTQGEREVLENLLLATQEHVASENLLLALEGLLSEFKERRDRH